MAIRAANPSWSRRIWNPGACTYQDTADNYGNAGALCFNSIKLHLTALKRNSFK